MDKGSCASWDPLRSRHHNVIRHARDWLGRLWVKNKEEGTEVARERLPLQDVDKTLLKGRQKGHWVGRVSTCRAGL